MACCIVNARAALTATSALIQSTADGDVIDSLRATEMAEERELAAVLEAMDKDDDDDDKKPRGRQQYMRRRHADESSSPKVGLGALHSGLVLEVDDGRVLAGTTPQLGPFKFLLEPVGHALAIMPTADLVRRTLVKQLLKKRDRIDMYNALWSALLRPETEASSTALFDRNVYDAPNGKQYPAWYPAVPDAFVGLLNSLYLTLNGTAFEVTCDYLCPHVFVALAQHVFRFSGDNARVLFASTTFKSRPLTMQDVIKNRAKLLKEFFCDDVVLYIGDKQFKARVTDLPNTILLYLARTAVSNAYITSLPSLISTSLDSADDNDGAHFLNRLRTGTRLVKWSQLVFARDEYAHLAEQLVADYYGEAVMNVPLKENEFSEAHKMQRHLAGLFEHACFVVLLLDCVQLELLLPYKTLVERSTISEPNVTHTPCTMAVVGFDSHLVVDRVTQRRAIKSNNNKGQYSRCDLIRWTLTDEPTAHLDDPWLLGVSDQPFVSCCERRAIGLDTQLVTLSTLLASSDYGLAKDALQRKMLLAKGDMAVVDRRIGKLVKRRGEVNKLARDYFGLHASTAAPNGDLTKCTRTALIHTPEYKQHALVFDRAYAKVYGNGDLTVVEKLEVEMKRSLQEMTRLATSEDHWLDPSVVFGANARRCRDERDWWAHHIEDHRRRAAKLKLDARTVTQKSLDKAAPHAQNLNRFFDKVKSELPPTEASSVANRKKPRRHINQFFVVAGAMTTPTGQPLPNPPAQ